ncbi:MAG: IS630 family transposase [Chlamydiales bacterium]|nr:IS630 family transposase [Chlamydiales bacterium]
MPEHVSLEDVDIWFQDEARVGQRGTLTRTWAAKGSRPRLTRQQQFEYAYIFGAVCPAKDQAVGLVLPAVNSFAMIAHLQHISKQVPQGRHAVLVLDQAAWHTTNKIQLFDNLTLLPLPPASPELNPVEQIWQMLRDNWLANRCYEGYEAIVDACCEAWNWFVDTPNRVRTLCSRSWCSL